MFDIGFWEILLIGVVALLVLGPERLPHAVRMTTAFIGKIRRSFIDVRAEIEREIHADELRQRIQKEMESSGINDLKDQLGHLRNTDGALRDYVEKQIHESGLKELEDEMNGHDTNHEDHHHDDHHHDEYHHADADQLEHHHPSHDELQEATSNEELSAEDLAFIKAATSGGEDHHADQDSHQQTSQAESNTTANRQHD